MVTYGHLVTTEYRTVRYFIFIFNGQPFLTRNPRVGILKNKQSTDIKVGSIAIGGDMSSGAGWNRYVPPDREGPIRFIDILLSSVFVLYGNCCPWRWTGSGLHVVQKQETINVLYGEPLALGEIERDTWCYFIIIGIGIKKSPLWGGLHW